MSCQFYLNFPWLGSAKITQLITHLVFPERVFAISTLHSPTRYLRHSRIWNSTAVSTRGFLLAAQPPYSIVSYHAYSRNHRMRTVYVRWKPVRSLEYA